LGREGGGGIILLGTKKCINYALPLFSNKALSRIGKRGRREGGIILLRAKRNTITSLETILI